MKKQKTKYRLTTKYADGFDPSVPLSEYPRPSMVRSSYMSLNGSWELETSYSEQAPKDYGSRITVPYPPESLLSGLEVPHSLGQVLHYIRDFSLPVGWRDDKVLLHFGAVDCTCKVYINDIPVGEHEGGYLPFTVDITDALYDGVNIISLAVKDDLLNRYPYGKQRTDRGGMWYTPVSGIWQSVWLESVPENYIEDIKITPSLDSVKIAVKTKASEKKLTLDDGTEYVFYEDEITVHPKEIINWSPENPHLYSFTLETENDKVESYFALRTVDIRTVCGVPRICLNGKPYLCHGLLDQGYFPDGIYTPASYDAYRDDILAAKALGFNMLRKHIKIEPEMFYYLCDTLGMLVFQDAVNNSSYSFLRDTALPTLGFKTVSDSTLHENSESRRIFEDNLRGMAKHLYNFPSVVYYTIFNEGWGQFCADDMYEVLRSEDSTRIIDSTSGWFWQKRSDVFSHHIYFKKLNVKISTERPTVISEFGGYSHRVKEHVFGDGNYGYKTFKSAEKFENAIISLYENEVLPLVKSGVSALVYTQLYDIEDETNGFLTYDRKIMKVNAARMREISERLIASGNGEV